MHINLKCFILFLTSILYFSYGGDDAIEIIYTHFTQKICFSYGGDDAIEIIYSLYISHKKIMNMSLSFSIIL